MALQGNLKDFGLPDIFQLISLQRRSGILTITSKEQTVRIIFYEGSIIEADSIPRRLEDRLGQVLVRSGLITQEQLEEALEYQKKTLKRLGLALVELGHISSENLKKALEIQVSQVIFRTFRWKEGEYRFEATDNVQYDPRVDVILSIDDLLMKGVQIVDEWPVIQRKIPDFSMVFSRTISLDDVEVEKKSEDEIDFSFGLDAVAEPKEATDKIILGSAEYQILEKVDGRRTVQDILDSVPMAEFTALKILFELYNRGLIQPVETTERIEEIVEVEPEPEARERISFLNILPWFAAGIIGLFFLIRLPVPFAPYNPPAQMPAYRIYIDACLTNVDDIILGYYILHSQWPPQNAFTIYGKANGILTHCLTDPVGRVVEMNAKAQSLELKFLDLHSRPIAQIIIPKPELVEPSLLDPLSGVQIRLPENE